MGGKECFLIVLMRSTICSAAPFTVTRNMDAAVFPAASVAEQLTETRPMENTVPEAGLHDADAAPDSSVAVTIYVTMAPAGLVALTAKSAGTIKAGGVVSLRTV